METKRPTARYYRERERERKREERERERRGEEETALIRMFLSNPPTQRSGNSVEEVWEPEGMENPKRSSPSKSTEQSSYELTETQAASTGINGYTYEYRYVYFYIH